MTVEQIYNETIKLLPAAERLRLATLILNNIAPQSVIDYSVEWSEDDLRDFSVANWQRLEKTEAMEDA